MIIFMRTVLLFNFGIFLGAQLDASPTGDQKVTGSTTAGSATFVEIDHEIFSQSFSPADSRRVVVSFWQKNVHSIV